MKEESMTFDHEPYQKERMHVLKMLEDGKISADEAAKLMSSLVGPEFVTSPSPAPKKERESLKGKKLRIQVFEGSQEKPKVNIKLPLSLAKLAGRFLSRHGKIKIEGLDLDLAPVLGNLDELDEESNIEVDDGKGKTRINLSIE